MAGPDEKPQDPLLIQVLLIVGVVLAVGGVALGVWRRDMSVATAPMGGFFAIAAAYFVLKNRNRTGRR